MIVFLISFCLWFFLNIFHEVRQSLGNWLFLHIFYFNFLKVAMFPSFFLRVPLKKIFYWPWFFKNTFKPILLIYRINTQTHVWQAQTTILLLIMNLFSFKFVLFMVSYQAENTPCFYRFLRQLYAKSPFWHTFGSTGPMALVKNLHVCGRSLINMYFYWHLKILFEFKHMRNAGPLY